jgi:choline O-acetyltransferase
MPSICELPVPRKLKWKINDTVNEWIDRAKEKNDNSINNLDFYLYKYEKFGRNFPKKVKMSPDSFVQLSMQLAYYK